MATMRWCIVVLMACCTWPGMVVGSSVKKHSAPETDNEVVAHEYESLYLVFGALVVGTFVLHVASTVPVMRALPVTVVFFLIGIVLALLATAGVLDDIGVVKRSYESWARIDPHLLLFCFLPPLIFGDAMGTDTHVARRTGAQCLILAGPGVVIGAFLTALVLQYLLPYGWDFATSLMVGSILAATDPVAVVSLLKDLGASPVLTMQIQGESLLNDGTAMVLFTVAYGMVEGNECGAGCITLFLLKSCVGASLFGLLIGWLFYLWIRRANNNLNHSASIIQISLTLACAYWSFIMAEGIFHISGVLSTVMAALVVAKKVWPVLVERQAMREFWHVVETIGNTLVFCLAGMLFGKAIPMHAGALKDCFWAFVVYVAITFIRLFMLLMLRPILNCCGHRVSIKDVLIMTWGGLRGMVGLALAILVERDRAGGELSEEDGQRVLFMVGGVAALTLVVNATTAPKLCEWLGVSATPAGRTVLVAKVARSAEAHVNAELQKLLEDKQASRGCLLTSVCESVHHLHEKVRSHFPDAAAARLPGDGDKRRWTHKPQLRSSGSAESMSSQASISSVVHGVVSHLRGSVSAAPDIDILWQEFHAEKNDLSRGRSSLSAFQFGADLPEIRKVLQDSLINAAQLSIVREVFLEIVRASYWDQLQEGKFLSGSKEPSILINSVSLAKEECCKRLADWKFLERDCVLQTLREAEESGKRRLMASARGTVYDHRQCVVGDARQLEVVKKFSERYFLRKHFRQQQRTIQLCTAFITAHQTAQSQIASHFGHIEHRFTDSPEEACVVLESQIQVFAAAKRLAQISKPVRKKMGTISEVHRLCDQFRRFVLAAHEGGVLQPKEAEALLEPVSEVLMELRRDRKKVTDDFASECAGANSSVEHMMRLAAALEIQRAWRERRARRILSLDGGLARVSIMSSADKSATERTEDNEHVELDAESADVAKIGEFDEPGASVSKVAPTRSSKASGWRQRVSGPGSPGASNFCVGAGGASEQAAI